MWLSRLILSRYTFPRWGNLASFAIVVAIVGVAIAIAQMILVLSIMTGFEDLLKRNYTRITSEMVVHSGVTVSVIETVAHHSGVVAVTPFYLSQAMLVTSGRVAGMVLEGIDLKTSSSVVDWDAVWRTPPIPSDKDWIWLGVQAAKKLGVSVGDTVDIIVGDSANRGSRPVVVTAITRFGIHDHDLHYARIDAGLFTRIFGQRDPLLKVRLAKNADPQQVRESLERSLDAGVVIRLWNELNRNIFLAVKHQKKLLFLVLEIVVALAAINVVNLLIMNTHFRKRDLAILRAIGMARGGVFVLFLVQGALIGGCGIVIGIGLGFAVCGALSRYQPLLLNEAIYNVTRLPISTDFRDVLWVSGVALVLCLLFSIFPAWRAVRMLPVDSLRND